MNHSGRHLLRKTGIRKRLFFSFVFVPLGLMTLFFFMYYAFSMDMILSKNEEASKLSASMTEEVLRLNVTKIEEEMISFGMEPYVSTFMNEADESASTIFAERLKEKQPLMNRTGLQIYNEQGSLLYTEGISGKFHMDTNKTASKKDTSSISWVYDKKQQTIVVVNEMQREDRSIGYTVCTFNEAILNTSFAKSNQIHNVLMIVDNRNTCLFGNASFPKGRIIDVNADKIEIGGKSYYLEAKPIEGMEWKVVNLVDSDYILEEIHNFRNMLLTYAVAFLCLLAIIATFIYHSIFDPIDNILRSMRTLDENNLANNRVEDHGNDEIHELSINFNDLLNRVQELLNTVEMEQEQKRETQFQLLQAQINPHFLFNTLNTLHFLAIMNEDKPVSEGISALAKLLRNTIVDSKEVVSVREEIENLKHYIVIQKLRFGDLFETVYNIDENVMNCQILKLLLQPIVENSILHAFVEDKENQLLTIRAKEEGMYLKIEIGDNGKGFGGGTREVGNKKLSSIGIANIQERIQLMYGDKYSMEIQSVVNKGTIITLLLPLVKGDSDV